jgi:hypothetical protein
MTLEKAFAELRYELSEVVAGHGGSPELVGCGEAFDESYRCYQQGDARAGFLRIQEALHILWKV